MELKQKGFLFFTRKSVSILTKKLGNGKHSNQGIRTVMERLLENETRHTVSLSPALYPQGVRRWVRSDPTAVPQAGERDLARCASFSLIAFVRARPRLKLRLRPFP